MIYFLVATFTFILSYVHKINGKVDYSSTKWAMLFAACVIYLSYQIWKKYHWSAGLVSLYFCLNSVNTFANFANQYEKYTPVNKLLVYHLGAVGLLSFFLLYYVVNRIKKSDYKKLDTFFAIVCIIDAAYVIIQALNGNYWSNRGGLWANVSINGVFISILIPFLFRRYFKYFVPLAVIACLVTKSSVSVGAVSVVMGTYAFFYFKEKKWGRYLIPAAVICVIFLFAHKYDSNLFSDSHRFKHQGSAIAEFIEPVKAIDYKLKNGTTKRILKPIDEPTSTKYLRYLTGWGASTFPFFGIKSQKIYKLEWIGYAQWAHSDWLQLGLEGGIIGLILCINLFFWVLWYARFDYILFSQIMCYGASMVFLYPLHYPLHAFLALYFIKKSLEYKRIVRFCGYSGYFVNGKYIGLKSKNVALRSNLER